MVAWSRAPAVASFMTTDTVSRVIAPGAPATVSTVLPTALFAVVESLS
jgi:hypothetical protein